MPGVRVEKVEVLRDAVEEGSYYVESDKLARRVVNEHLQDAVRKARRERELRGE
jgi:anti-sigma28 factor (negative regulator of flagellin synthesis)